MLFSNNKYNITINKQLINATQDIISSIILSFIFDEKNKINNNVYSITYEQISNKFKEIGHNISKDTVKRKISKMIEIGIIETTSREVKKSFERFDNTKNYKFRQEVFLNES